MKAKHIIHTLAVLLALGTAAFFVVSPVAQTTNNSWETWIDEQTDTVLKSVGEMDEKQRTEMRANIRKKFSSLAAELEKEIPSPPQMKDYAILQTVKELRNAYDEDYNRKHQNTTVRVLYTAGDTEIFSYDESIPLAEVDAKYPRDAWLQMLLDKGITIINADAYWEYLFLRDRLVHIERQPNVWKSGHFGIPATEDWETYKAAYISYELDQIEKRLKEDNKTHLFFSDHQSEKPRFLLEKSIELPNSVDEPGKFFKEFSLKALKEPQPAKALRDAYDEKYNERYAITSGSISHTRDGVTVFSYKFPLPMSEVDAKYPRDEWLQMLLDKGISIDNFEEYWAYLSQRDTLVELEKQPKVWSSGLFGIAPTEDWETYKAAYLEQMVAKLHRNGEIILLGKAEEGKNAAMEALKKATEHLEKLERNQHLIIPQVPRVPPLDR